VARKMRAAAGEVGSEQGGREGRKHEVRLRGEQCGVRENVTNR